MAGTGVVEVEGARELRRTLRAVDSGLDDLKAVHGQVAALVSNAATGTAPKRSGRLAATVRGSGTRTMATVRAGRKAVPYAGVIHWGWPARRISPNPWLTDTASSLEPAWVELYTVGVQGLIDVSVARYARTSP